ncbi:MAG: energy-coupling factor transporter transmembrane protein EcfT [Oscillospiraceae bacterium]|nr:energy-coupling factor transporter transmembrane protein EcfT [Oscillospiraceae bacterium]
MFSSIDPRVKIGASFFISVLLSFSKNFLAKSLVFVFVFVCACICKVDFKRLRFIVALSLFSSISNVFYIKNGNVILQIGTFIITDRIIKSLFLPIISMFTLALITLILAKTMKTTDFARAISSIFWPLSLLGINTNEMSITMILILRLVPMVFEESEKVIFAQKTRGALEKKSNVLKYVKSFIPIIVCTFVSCFQKAMNIALAMETRCYGAFPKRTSLKEFKIKKLDFFVVFVVIVLAIGVFFLNKIN